MTVSTSNGSAMGHPDVRFILDEPFASASPWLRSYFEEQILAGTRFEDGQTVQIGWMIVKLTLVQANCLEIVEPDFDSFPVRWSRGANNTLRHLSLQRAVCDLLKCEPDFPSIRQAGIVSANFASCKDFVLSREAPVASDSGWIFSEDGEAGNVGTFVSLYEIAMQKMSVIPLLALPPGASATFKANELSVSLGSGRASSNDHPFLRRLAEEPIIV